MRHKMIYICCFGDKTKIRPLKENSILCIDHEILMMKVGFIFMRHECRLS